MSPSSASAPPSTTLTLTASVTGLPAGIYYGKVWITSPTASTVVIDVTFTVTGGPAPTPGRKWTIMVYMNADNDLEEAGVEDVNEMEATVNSTEVTVVVEIDRTPSSPATEGRGYSIADGDWAGTRLYEIQQDSDPNVINSPFGAVGEINMGAAASLQAFIEASIASWPAQNYAVIIWNHGKSWISAGHDESTSPPNGDDLDIVEVGAALSGAITTTGITGFGLVVFDQCLNGSLEAAVQLAPYVLTMVGSEELAPGDGMDYTTTLAALKARPTMNDLELGQQFTRDFIRSYVTSNPADPTVTCSVIDLTRIAPVTTALNTLATNLNAAMASQTVALARALEEDEGYGTDESDPESTTDFVDLADLAVVLGNVSGNGTIISNASTLVSTVRGAVFYHDNGADHPFSYGLSVYAPQAVADFNSAGYSATTLAATTQWNEMLLSFYTQLAADSTGPTVSGLAVSSTTASVAAPVTISGNVSSAAGDTVRGCIYGGLVSGTVVTFLFDIDLDPGNTVISNGQEIGAWTVGPDPLSATWDTRAFAVTNGTSSFFASVSTGASCLTVEAVHRSNGLADNKDVVLVFDCNGAFVRCFQTSDASSPREVRLGAGDQLDIYTEQLDLATSTFSYALQGTLTLTTQLGLGQAQVPNGSYIVGICAEDFAGNIGELNTLITVNNP